MLRLLALALLPLLIAANDPRGILEVDVTGLRNPRGLVHVCITRDPAHFPDCRGDPEAWRQTTPASIAHLRFAGLIPGRYAVTLFHDENANQRLDTFIGIPREGFGFSNGAIARFGAPRFDAVAIDLHPGFTRQSIRLQYLL
ncbi:MAG: DUF2141 domain-containing protein [Sphingomicrobium sp.]